MNMYKYGKFCYNQRISNLKLLDRLNEFETFLVLSDNTTPARVQWFNLLRSHDTHLQVLSSFCTLISVAIIHFRHASLRLSRLHVSFNRPVLWWSITFERTSFAIRPFRDSFLRYLSIDHMSFTKCFVVLFKALMLYHPNYQESICIRRDCSCFCHNIT